MRVGAMNLPWKAKERMSLKGEIGFKYIVNFSDKRLLFTFEGLIWFSNRILKEKYFVKISV